MGDIVHMSEFNARKARLGNQSQFGPIAKGIVKPGKKSKDEAALRQHEDEAIATGNSWREKDRG